MSQVSVDLTDLGPVTFGNYERRGAFWSRSFTRLVSGGTDSLVAWAGENIPGYAGLVQLMHETALRRSFPPQLVLKVSENNLLVDHHGLFTREQPGQLLLATSLTGVMAYSPGESSRGTVVQPGHLYLADLATVRFGIAYQEGGQVRRTITMG